jgi:ribosome-binding protein aMBF1 (putative translation factor)
MTKTLKEFKVNLYEATASKSDLQFIKAKTHHNDHFEARRYIADKLLSDKDLANAYKSLETIHTKFNSYVGNDAVMLRQKLERNLQTKLKQKVSNWDDVWGAL